MNFMGLGFSFGTKNEGKAVAAFEKLGAGLQQVTGFMKGITEAGGGLANMVGTQLGREFEALSATFSTMKGIGSAAFSVVGIGVASVALGVTGLVYAFKGLGGAFKSVLNLGPSIVSAIGAPLKSAAAQLDLLTKGGMNLTSSLEGQAVSTGQTLRQLGANMGYTGKELDSFIAKATETSISLAIGADTAGKALRAWDESQSEMRALGFKSAAGLARFSEAFGINADLLRNNTLAMRKQLGFSDKAMSNVVGSMVALGQQTGDVAGALGELNQMQGFLARNAALMGDSMPEKQMVDFATSITAAGRAFFATGEDSDKAREFANSLGETMLKSRENIANMFAGTEGDIDSFAKELGVATGDISKAFGLIKEGPSGFITGMTEMYRSAKKNSTNTAEAMNFLRGRLSSVLGEDMTANLMSLFAKMDAKTLKSMSIVRGATADLDNLGKEAHDTGRTMADSLDFAQERMFDSFRKLGKPQAREWLTRVQGGMKDMRAQFAEMGKDSGPMGQFARKMSEISILGAQALLPDALQPITMIMGTLSEKMGPTIEMLGSMGANFTSLTGIITGAALGLMGWAAQARLTQKDTESFGDAMVRVGKEWINSSAEMINAAGTFFLDLSALFVNFDWKNLFAGEEQLQSTGNGVDELWSHAEDKFDKVKWTSIYDNFKEGFGVIWDLMWTDENKAKVQEKLDEFTKWLKDSFVAAVASVDWGAIAGDIMSQLLGGLASLPGKLGEKIGNIWAESDQNDTGKDLGSWFGAKLGSFIGGDKLFAETMSQQDKIKSGLQSITATAKDEFGNSMNTFIGEDMQTSAEVTEYYAQKMSKSLENVTLQGADLFQGMWYGIEKSTSDSLARIDILAQGMVSSLAQILRLSTDIVDRSMNASAPGAVPAVNEARERQLKAQTGEAAIHDPYWYRGAGGYEELFVNRMDRLILAVESMRVSGTGPTISVGAAQTPRSVASAAPFGVPYPGRGRSGGVTG